MKRKIIINKGSALITIPKALAEALNLLEKGRNVNVTIEGKRIIVIATEKYEHKGIADK
jgi:antitoxin component of MazEF toxin-antitoxin module